MAESCLNRQEACRRRRWWIVFLLGFVSGSITLFAFSASVTIYDILAHSRVEGTHTMPFDSETWKKVTASGRRYTARTYMVQDLLRCYDLRGMNRDQVRNLLGEPSDARKLGLDSWDCAYPVGRSETRSDGEFLALRFDSSGRVLAFGRVPEGD